MKMLGRGARRAFSGLALPLPIALLAVLSMGPAAAGAGAADPSSVSIPSARAQRALRFWTPARMRRAEPLELEMHRSSRPTVALAGRARTAGEAPHRYPPRAPQWGASASSAFEVVADPAAEATRQNGVIFIALPGGFDRCSGTSVNAPNLSVVITAGHCVNSGGPEGEWLAGRWVFVPGYRYGQRPFGVFPAKWIGATPQWLSTGSENFDVGAAVVTRNERGERLGEAVGGAGVAWGLKAGQVFDVHGYPAAPPFDGETQRVCTQTPFLGHDLHSFLSPGPLNLAVDCNVTGGASGGGWTISGNLLNSVTNYGYPDDPDTDFGAYFGKDVGRLFTGAGRIR